LLARDLRLRHPGRSIDFSGEPEQTGDEEDGAKDADASNRVGAAVEDLRHRSDAGRTPSDPLSLPRLVASAPRAAIVEMARLIGDRRPAATMTQTNDARRAPATSWSALAYTRICAPQNASNAVASVAAI